jgi:uncharacterized membrane protein
VAYRILLFVHVLAVIGWLGAGIVFQILSERALGTRDDRKIQALLSMGDDLGPVYFGIVTVLVLITGIAMVLNGDWSFGEPFVIGGLAGIVSSGALGGAVIGPSSQRAQASFQEGGVVTPEIEGLLAKVRNFGRLDLALMIVVVFLMTYKPGT